MSLIKTDKTRFDSADILKFILDYEMKFVPEYEKLWQYYIGNNTAIMKRKESDPNNPNNRLPVSYGRKLVTTYTGYAYRPRFITYKANVEEIRYETETIEGVPIEKTNEFGERIKIISNEEKFMIALQKNYDMNNEHIKTSRHGRNTAIYGVSYELFYIDGQITNDPNMPLKSVPKFFVVDPKEMILLYDYSSEPKKVGAIRYYKTGDSKYKVEVYYADRIELYERIQGDDGDWILTNHEGPFVNYYKEVPVVPYYLGDEMLGVIKPVLPLIDANDVLFSDSMNEFDRFAYAYLIMKRFGITDPTKKKEPQQVSSALQMLKKFRLFEHLDKDAEIKFLTKDIPTEFIKFMSDRLKIEIHIQSHIPDFNEMKTGDLSGAAIDRLLFDFENLVSSAEADFDVGLLDRMRLIARIFNDNGTFKNGDPSMIMISHKRNRPLNMKEYADTALIMKTAGFSRYLVADIMPDDVIPNIEVELQRQDKDQEMLMPDVDTLLGTLDQAVEEEEAEPKEKEDEIEEE